MISKFILIFAFIHQIFANFIIYIENPCIVVFNKQYNDDIMKINNISYRESINPISFYYFNQGNWNVNRKPSMIFNNVNLIDSLTKNKDIEISQKWTLLDSIEYYKHFKGPVHLLATTNIEFNTNFTYNIEINSKSFYYTSIQNLAYIQTFTQDIGHYSIKLFIKHNSKHYKFYTSRKLGFTNSYQLGLWESLYRKVQSNINTNILTNVDNIIIQKYSNDTNNTNQENSIYNSKLSWVVHKLSSWEL